MQIDVLANKTVKITLNRLDMSEYDVKYESLSHKSPDTKRLLVELLAAVRMEKKLDLSGERLFIEAFPKNDGGCMLYISCLESGRNQITKQSAKQRMPAKLYETIICETKDIDSLGKLCVSLDNIIERNHPACCTSLYWEWQNCENRYRLILTDLNPVGRDIKGILREFGDILSGDDITMAKTTEHFKQIIEKNAAKQIAEAIG